MTRWRSRVRTCHDEIMDYLTQEERALVQDLGRIYRRFNEVAGSGITREDDLAEVRMLIHGLQNMILKQAAARAYPDEFRLLGGLIEAFR